MLAPSPGRVVALEKATITGSRTSTRVASVASKMAPSCAGVTGAGEDS
jgi:hypothetical protein